MDWLSFVINNSVFVGLATTLLHFTWQGLLLACLLLLLLKNINTRHANLRYSVSLFLLVLCVVAPVITFYIVYDPQASHEVDVKQVLSDVSASASQIGNAIGTLNETNHFSLSIATAEIVEQFRQWQLRSVLPFFALAWIVGVMLMSSRLILQLVNVYKLPYQGISQPDDELQRTFERLMEQLGVNLVTRLLISSKVDVPMVIGWLKPVVLLPSSMLMGLTPKQLEMLLAHELAHVRRHDYFVNFLQTLLEVVLFFHPAVKWISKQIRTERECCCDEIAVAHCGSAVAYATALTEAEMSRFNVPSLAMAASGSDLKERVFRVIGHANDSAVAANSWTVGDWKPQHKASGMLAALLSLSLTIAVLLFSSRDVIGMTTHADKPNKKDEFLLVIDPKTSDAQPEKNEAKLNKVTEDAEDQNKMTSVKSVTIENKEANPSETVTGDRISQNDQKKLLLSDSSPEPIVSHKVEPSEAYEQKTETASIAVNIPEKESDESDEARPGENEAAEAVLPDSTDNTDVAEISVSEIAADNSGVINKTNLITPETSQDLTSSLNFAEAANSDNEPDVTTTIELDSVLIEQVEVSPEVVTIPPVLIRSRTPNYPRQALMRNLSDDVMVSFTVNTEGRIENISFRADTHHSFRSSVSRALSKWRFEPATENGEPVSTELTRIFSFTDPRQAGLAITGSRIARL